MQTPPPPNRFATAQDQDIQDSCACSPVAAGCATRHTACGLVLRLRQQTDCSMSCETTAGVERQPPQWAIFAIAVIADLLAAAGFVPGQYEALLRSVVMYCLYREWTLAFACGFILPRSLPLAGVCFFKQKWLALKVSVSPKCRCSGRCSATYITTVSLSSLSLSLESCSRWASFDFIRRNVESMQCCLLVLHLRGPPRRNHIPRVLPVSQDTTPLLSRETLDVVYSGLRDVCSLQAFLSLRKSSAAGFIFKCCCSIDRANR